MLTRRGLQTVAFALILLLGIAAGIAERRAVERGGSGLAAEWTRVVTSPLLRAGAAVSTGAKRFVRIFRTNSSLKRENKDLRAAVMSARQRALQADEYRQEAERLRGLLDLRGSLPYRTIPARVLVRPATPWAETCTLDAGGDDGVRLNAAVIARDGLVGRVVRVGRRTSVVSLLRDSLSSVACLSQRTRAPGICSGQGEKGLPLVMDYIPAGSDVRKGDFVVTSGEGGVFPAGLKVGVVTAVADAGHSHFKTAEVKPTVEFRSVEEVLVVAGTQ